MKLKFIALILAAASGAALAQTQGVSKNEIVIGSGQDLSGPLAGYSKPLRNGMMMRTEEINEQGGINGRKLKLIVEDHGYDPKKAVLVTQKMVQRDKIFAMVGTIGTAMNLARRLSTADSRLARADRDSAPRRNPSNSSIELLTLPLKLVVLEFVATS